MKASPGFTLVEMLVAVFIFALISAAGVAIVSFGVDAKAATAEATDKLRDIQLARAILGADLAQPMPRVTRSAYGDATDAPFAGGDPRQENGVVLSLVRGGWANPGEVEARSDLQFVQYVLEDGTLYRVSRPRLDATPTTPVERRALLKGVSEFRIRFFTANQWQDQMGRFSRKAESLPQAVSIDLTLEGFGPLHQLFLVRG